MDRLKAKMFNKKAADPHYKPDEIIKALDLKEGDTVADIGAGGGYYSLRFAEIVGSNGKVFAVDKNKEFLSYIKEQAEEKGLDNIATIEVKENIELPENSLDLIFMRNLTHHLKNRTEYFKGLKKFLKSVGKIAVIDYHKGSLFDFHRFFFHSISKNSIINEMKRAGFKLVKDFNFLEDQHFTLYEKE